MIRLDLIDMAKRFKNKQRHDGQAGRASDSPTELNIEPSDHSHVLHMYPAEERTRTKMCSVAMRGSNVSVTPVRCWCFFHAR